MPKFLQNVPSFAHPKFRKVKSQLPQGQMVEDNIADFTKPLTLQQMEMLRFLVGNYTFIPKGEHNVGDDPSAKHLLAIPCSLMRDKNVVKIFDKSQTDPHIPFASFMMASHEIQLPNLQVRAIKKIPEFPAGDQILLAFLRAQKEHKINFIPAGNYRVAVNGQIIELVLQCAILRSAPNQFHVLDGPLHGKGSFGEVVGAQHKIILEEHGFSLRKVNDVVKRQNLQVVVSPLNPEEDPNFDLYDIDEQRIKLHEASVEKRQNQLAAITKEAELQANFTKVESIVETEDAVFTVMPYLGKNLTKLDFANMNADERISIAVQVLNLTTAMNATKGMRLGILHRDLKPANLVYDPITKRVEIIDFGFAHTEDDPHAHSSSAGTKVYMAPELFLGKAPSEASEVYALAGILAQVLLGISENDLMKHKFAYEKKNAFPLKAEEAGIYWCSCALQGYDFTGTNAPNSGPIIAMLEQMSAINPKDRPSLLDVEKFFFNDLGLYKKVQATHAETARQGVVNHILTHPCSKTLFDEAKAFAAQNPQPVSSPNAVVSAPGAVPFGMISAPGAITTGVVSAPPPKSSAAAPMAASVSAADHKYIEAREKLFTQAASEMPMYKKWLTDAEAMLGLQGLNVAAKKEIQSFITAINDHQFNTAEGEKKFAAIVVQILKPLFQHVSSLLNNSMQSGEVNKFLGICVADHNLSDLKFELRTEAVKMLSTQSSMPNEQYPRALMQPFYRAVGDFIGMDSAPALKHLTEISTKLTRQMQVLNAKLPDLFNAIKVGFVGTNSDGVKQMQTICQRADLSNFAKMTMLVAIAKEKTEDNLSNWFKRQSVFGEGRHANVEDLYQELANFDVTQDAAVLDENLNVMIACCQPEVDSDSHHMNLQH